MSAEDGSQIAELQAARIQERLTARERMDAMASMGTEILSPTHLVQEGPIDRSDVEAVHNYLGAGVELTAENYLLIDHVLLTGHTARTIGSQLQTLHPEQYAAINCDELEVVGNLHDDGKRVTFAWNRNELAGDIVAKKIGIKQELMAKIPTAMEEAQYVQSLDHPPTAEDVEEYFSRMTIEHRIITIADILSKRVPQDWSIRPFTQVMEYHYNSRGTIANRIDTQNADPLRRLKSWASERVISSEQIDFAGMLYTRLYTWLQEAGIDPVHIQKTVEQIEDTTELNVRILSVRDNQRQITAR